MSRSLVVVLIIFLWGSGQALDGIVRFSIKTDYYLLSSVGLPWLYFIFTFGLFGLFVLSIYYLFRPAPIGLIACLATLGASVALTVLYAVMILNDLAGAREAYAVGREARGLPVREGALDMIFSLQGIITGSIVAIVLAAFAAYWVFRNARYFSSPRENEG
ncbi:MAG: hypothetical protein KIT18_03390 [Burkholderiales bacterium]|nr:hypothetical protein [Burkholderiales bacterium]